MESEYRRNFKGSPPPKPPRLRRDLEEYEVPEIVTQEKVHRSTKVLFLIFKSGKKNSSWTSLKQKICHEMKRQVELCNTLTRDTLKHSHQIIRRVKRV